MDGFYSCSSKNKLRSANNIKNNIRILKYFKINNKNESMLFSKFDEKKNNNLLISHLLNTSKKLVKNNSRYKSYTDLPKTFQYFYPYKPFRNGRNNTAKNNLSSNSNISIISTYNTINIEKNAKANNIKLIPKETKFKLNLRHFKFTSYNVNEDIFFDFIDGYNNNSQIKEKFNNYLSEHPIEKLNDINIFQLFDMLQNFKIDYNDNNFFNETSSSKINKFKLKNNLSVKFKLSSLTVVFYKKKRKNINHLNNKDYLFDNSIYVSKLKNKNNYLITKIKFPFGFLPFFYGINNIEFLKFLISIIDYDYIKCNFFMDFKKFIKNYRFYRKDHPFYGENSYLQTFYNKNKEYFEYDWDVKNKNNKNINHYIMRIILPQMKIIMYFENKSIAKFYYSVDTNKIIYLLKEKFKLWDFHILKLFSEFKSFRQEINKIICDKLSYSIKNNNLKVENKSYISYNNLSYYKKNYNYNKMNTKLNTLIQNENSFEFFYSHNLKTKPEGYFFQFQIPKIHIVYQNGNSVIDKSFSLGIKRLSQINKLRKSFQIEDIIRYSMVVVYKKNNDSNKRKFSTFENNGYRRNLKRSSTLKSNDSFQRINRKTVSTKINDNNITNNTFNRLKVRQTSKRESIRKIKKQDLNKDIKLNLDKYIFNFDEDILKFIKPLEEKNQNEIIKEKIMKYNDDISKRKGIKENSLIFNKSINQNVTQNKYGLNVEIGKIKLVFTNNDLKKYEYCFEDEDNSYLLDNTTNIWEKYIENNLDKYKSNEMNLEY